MTRRALLVGINKYGAEYGKGASLASLTTPTKDVERLRKLLRSSIDPAYTWTQTRTLPDAEEANPDKAQVTSGTLWSALEDLFCDHGSRGDDLLFYFAGHGLRRYRTGVLATSESTPRSGGVPMIDILDLIRGVGEKVASITVILDCCTSGMMTDIAGSAQLPINTSILTASFSNRSSYERSGEAAVFSQVLCEGLSGGAVLGLAGRVSVTSLASFVCERFTDENLGPADQQPTFHGVLTNIPVLRASEGALSPSDIDGLVEHFTDGPGMRIPMTHEHEGPDTRGKKRTPHTPEEFKTPQMLQFDYFKRLQGASLLRVDAENQALYHACGYDTKARKTQSFADVYLTDSGQAWWAVADRRRAEKNQLARRSV